MRNKFCTHSNQPELPKTNKQGKYNSLTSPPSELHLESDLGGHYRFGGSLFFHSRLIVVGQAVEGVVHFFSALALS